MNFWINQALLMPSVFNFLQFLFYSCVFLKHLTLAENGTNFIYHEFNEANLQTNGIAQINPNGLLELTNISHHQIGRAFFPFPFKFSSQSLSFSTTFVFAVVPEIPTLGGHGFAFTISPSFDFTGALSVDWLGLFNDKNIGLDSNHVFAVEFDTIQSVVYHDMDNNHVGVDLNSLVSNVSASASYFTDSKNKSLELISGNPMQAWIDYDEDKKLLNVTVAPLTTGKPIRPLISTSIDLSLIFLDSMYVGFSSSTGSMASSHYILGWSFNTSGQAQDLVVSKLPSLPPLPQPKSSKKSSKKLNLIVIPVSVTASVILIIAFSYVYYIRKKKYEELCEDWEEEYGPQRFSYRVLYKATKGFKDEKLLGFGGFGRVFRGVLPSTDIQVAVKKFSHESHQGMKEFISEIASMGRLRHRNLVRLLGYCRRKGELLLVYDYMPNGSLDKFLFHKESPNLNWIHRYQILKGVAAALLYLHEEWEQVVLHRDVKASNVMLDADLNARLGDFGLAKFYDHGSIPHTTYVVGTVGYLAPEVSKTGRVTTSSDVFAFGILMLEVACGRRPIEPERPPEEVILVDWVLDCLKRERILETSDPRLEGKYMVEEMDLVLKLGLLCTEPTPARRPIMRQVVKYLDGKASLPELPTNGASVGLITVSQVADGDFSLLFPESTDYSCISATDSILSCGR